MRRSIRSVGTASFEVTVCDFKFSYPVFPNLCTTAPSPAAQKQDDQITSKFINRQLQIGKSVLRAELWVIGCGGWGEAAEVRGRLGFFPRRPPRLAITPTEPLWNVHGVQS